MRLATPLLLCRADLRAVARVSGALLPAFLLGTVGTVIGSLVGFGAIALFNIQGEEAVSDMAKVSFAFES